MISFTNIVIHISEKILEMSCFKLGDKKSTLTVNLIWYVTSGVHHYAIMLQKLQLYT